MISSYSVGDMAIVNQYQYLDQAVALVVVGPIWKIIYSLGVSIVKGKEDSKKGQKNFGFVNWNNKISNYFFDEPMLMFFGGEVSFMLLFKQYLISIKFILLLFLFNKM